MTASSSNKKMSVDRLSALPDDILCYILSFLEMRYAAITCLLSKRWQFLWTELPGLRFECHYSGPIEDLREFVIRVHRTLAICNRHNLERFEVRFMVEYYSCFDFDVNAWIGFAVRNMVKEFTLMLPFDSYTLPQMMYSNPSWTSLSLELCIMAPRETIQWQSLTTLYLSCMCLDGYIFEKIFSGCPVLSSLDLRYCYGFNRLEVNSPSLHRLAIIDDKDEGNLKISAPYIHTFHIDLESEYRKLWVGNFKSLVRAEINLSECLWEAPKLWKKRIKQLFGSIRNVKMLKLDHGSIQLLSLIARNLQLPQSTTRCLEIHATRNKRSIPGIALLLESSSNLETLVIHGYPCYKVAFPSNLASKNDLDCDLSHLKIVRFKNFGDPNSDNGELMLTLARILLKRAIVLEKMVIDFQGFAATSSTAFYEMTQELLGYSRFSQKAVVLFCK